MRKEGEGEEGDEAEAGDGGRRKQRRQFLCVTSEEARVDRGANNGV